MTAFPRVGTYSSLKGDGSPLAGHPDRIAALARWDRVVIDLGCMEAHPEIAQGLRAVNPAIALDAYVVWTAWNNPNGPQFFRDFWNVLVETDGFLVTTTGRWWSWSNVNQARKATVEALGDLILRYAADWQGVFIDIIVPKFPANAVWGSEAMDWQRMGFASAADFSAQWEANGIALADKLKSASKPVVTNYANGIQGVDGCMREDFPHQFGGTWESNISGPNGLLHLPFADGSWICSAPAGSIHLDPENQRRHRYGLATACLFGGFHSFGRYESDAEWCVDRLDWWFPEYDAGGRGKGWLGEPIGAAWHITESNGKPADLWGRRFERGVVVVNPSSHPHSIYFDERYRPIGGTAKTAWNVPAHDALIAEAV